MEACGKEGRGPTWAVAPTRRRRSLNALPVACFRKVRLSDPDTRNWLRAAGYSHGASGRLLTDHFLRPEEHRSVLLQWHHPGLFVLRITEFLRPRAIPHRGRKNALLIEEIGIYI
jgi:hypothetical protein